MVDIDRHRYIPIKRFFYKTITAPLLAVMVAIKLSLMSSKLSQLSEWESFTWLIDNVFEMFKSMYMFMLSFRILESFWFVITVGINKFSTT